MRIRLGELRELIRTVVMESGGGTEHTFNVRDTVTMMTTADREAIDRQSKFDINDPEEDLPPHLREPDVDYEDEFGPVPPRDNEGDPYAMTDPFTQDWHVIPRPPIFTRFRGP